MHAKLAGRWRGLAAVPMDNGTRTQYPQTTATPRPSKFRMQFPHDMDRRTLKNRRISTIRLQYLKYTQGNCMRNYRDAVRTQHHATDPQARRTPEGPDGPVAAPVGGGGAWPGFEATRRAKLAARTARGRAAAHGHTKQPGPTRSSREKLRDLFHRRHAHQEALLAQAKTDAGHGTRSLAFDASDGTGT